MVVRVSPQIGLAQLGGLDTLPLVLSTVSQRRSGPYCACGKRLAKAFKQCPKTLAADRHLASGLSGFVGDLRDRSQSVRYAPDL